MPATVQTTLNAWRNRLQQQNRSPAAQPSVSNGNETEAENSSTEADSESDASDYASKPRKKPRLTATSVPAGNVTRLGSNLAPLRTRRVIVSDDEEDEPSNQDEPRAQTAMSIDDSQDDTAEEEDELSADEEEGGVPVKQTKARDAPSEDEDEEDENDASADDENGDNASEDGENGDNASEDDEDESDSDEDDLASMLQPNGNTYNAAARKSKEHLLEFMFEKETELDRPAMRGITKDAFMRAGHGILASMYTKVLVELLGGNLPLAIRCDPKLKKRMLRMKNRSGTQHPGCYVRFLVDERGLSPSPMKIRKGLGWLRVYARLDDEYELDEQHQKEIESMVGRKENNFRKMRKGNGLRYLSRNILKGDWTLKQDRVDAIEEFADKLVEHLDSLGAEAQNEPLVSPLKYVGYAKNLKQRNELYHDKHESSNFLMDLFEAIMMWLYKEKYKMRWFPVVYCACKHEVAGAEIIVTALADGYSATGLGFAHHSAGETTGSHEKATRKGKTTGLDDGDWDSNMDWVLRYTSYKEQMNHMASYFEQRRNDYNELEQTLQEMDVQVKAAHEAHLNSRALLYETMVKHCAHLDALNGGLDVLLKAMNDAIDAQDRAAAERLDDEEEGGVMLS